MYIDMIKGYMYAFLLKSNEKHNNNNDQ